MLLGPFLNTLFQRMSSHPQVLILFSVALLIPFQDLTKYFYKNKKVDACVKPKNILRRNNSLLLPLKLSENNMFSDEKATGFLMISGGIEVTLS